MPCRLPAEGQPMCLLPFSWHSEASYRKVSFLWLITRFCKIFPDDSEPQRWGCVKSEVACTSWCYLQLCGLTPALVFIKTSQSEMFNIESWSPELVDQAVVLSITHHGQLCFKKTNHLSCLSCPPPSPSWEGTCNSCFFLFGLPDRVHPQVCSLSICDRKWEIRPTYVICEFPSVDY